ncbi:unnamed protein product [Rotaria socialis]|uniref:Uncharacterized protein n=1 Tax=Rotaria socialis TaxID=392032 RepID=A0A817MW05_9BILA|nr:unnamed protein product [Rotaria socialis]CAF3572396.1 unnamed protein product [Rotaria socialis]CAF4188914.1 unnamed protein product [Rotaria socialis]CAF4338032.1 unnamed protein product [Rotaria socialis]
MDLETTPLQTEPSIFSKPKNFRLSYIIITLLVGFSITYIYLKSFHYRYILPKLNLVETTNNIEYYRKTKLSAASLEYFDDVNSIPGTSGSGIPKKIRATLTDKYGGVDAQATTFYGAEKAVKQLEQECGWNSNTSNFVHPECMNQFHFIRKKSQFNLSNYYNDVDIVIPSIRDLDFLEDWKPFFQHFHLIIIQDGDPEKFLRIPSWADYELYNRRDIETALGKDKQWIISTQDASIRNFGFLVSNKTFIYTIDDDCLPAKDANGSHINVLSRHIQNLVTNSTPYFFNTLYDPYRDGADFVRGYPYSLRRGVPTAISHGIWLNAPDYDAPTQLLKVDERNTLLADITVTVPAGVLYPMCSMNVAFNRELIGPAFMQGLSGIGMPWARYDDMFAGWASKVVADHLGLGVKTGAPYVRHNKASNPFTNLKKEYMGLFWQEDIIDFFQRVRFSSSATTPQACYLELSQMIRKNLSRLNEYFGRLARAMEIWIEQWNRAQRSKSHFQPSRKNRRKTSRGRFAVLTICRTEPGYLPIWLKYYRQYFPDEDIYILDNDSSDGSTSRLTVNVIRVHSDAYFDHYWLIETVQNQVQELLKSGYKYVLFTEIDEMVVPDPLKYPLGLYDYINRTNQSIVRVKAYDVRHNVALEPKLKLNESILQQRRFRMRHSMYDKPLLTNRPVHWQPGFHTCQESSIQDENLLLFHLQRMDHDFYMQRTDWKSRQNLKMEDIKKGMGVQHAFRGEQAEHFFATIVGEISDIPTHFRSPAVF